MLDAVYWKKGCSSLGKLRYCVLLGVGNKQLELCLMDLKEAVQAAALVDESADVPEDQAQRVVEGARHWENGCAPFNCSADQSLCASFYRRI